MMTAHCYATIDLLRHGETLGGKGFCGSTDVPLTEQGWRQLRGAVANGTLQWNRIIASPLGRCAEFARVLAAERALPATFDKRLREMHFGLWENRSPEMLMSTEPEALKSFWNDPKRNSPPQGESLDNFEERVLSAWHDIIDRHAGENVLLVTHGGVIRTILCHIRQHPIERLMEFEVGHASLHRIQILKGSEGFHYRQISGPLCLDRS